jgi:hypothetical protein
MSKTNTLHREITDFAQKEHEKFYESWEKFKDLLLRCPHHGFETWRLVQYFYNGLTQSNHNMIESMNGGSFLSLTHSDAFDFLDKLFESSQQWDFSSRRDKSCSVLKKGGLYEVKEEANLRLKIDSFARKVVALSVSRSVNSTNFPPREGCSSCGNQMHKAQNCPSLSSFTENSMEQVNAFHDFRKQSGGPFSETYNPRWQNHPNFSWREINHLMKEELLINLIANILMDFMRHLKINSHHLLNLLLNL